MNAKLLVILGKTIRRNVALQLPAVLGRSREADIKVTHPLISRRHCELSENGGLLMLRDLASLNGTMIGGRRIELAPLLPGGEFMIGPLTFRVLYEFDGDLESVPATHFMDETEGAIEAGDGSAASGGIAEMPEVNETLPTAGADESHSGDLALPDLMALADADPEELPPAAYVPPPQALPIAPTGSVWPMVAVDKLPTVPLTDVLNDPLDVDSSLQSGSHAKESPWAVEPPAVEKPQQSPKVPVRRGPTVPAKTAPPAPPETSPAAPVAESVVRPPAKEKPQKAPPPSPPKKPTYGEEIDPEFGSFLEGLE